MVVSNPYKVHTFQSQGDKTAPASEMADRFADIVGVEGEGRGLWEQGAIAFGEGLGQPLGHLWFFKNYNRN